MNTPEKTITTFDIRQTALFSEIKLPTLSEEVLKKHGLFYHSYQEPMKPVFFDHSEVWATAITSDKPVYAVFNAGTNKLVILEKAPDSSWKEVKLEEVKNLYGLMWKMTCNMPEIKSATPE